MVRAGEGSLYCGRTKRDREFNYEPCAVGAFKLNPVLISVQRLQTGLGVSQANPRSL